MYLLPFLQSVSLTFARVPVVGQFASDSRIPPSAPAQLASLRATACPSCPPPRLPRAHPPSTPNTRPTRIIDASSTLECTFILSSCKSWNYCQPLGASQAWRIPIPIGRSLILSPPLPFELFLPGPLCASNTFKQPPCTTAHDIVRDAGRSSHLHENKSLDTTSSLLVAESVTVAQHGRSSPNAGFAKERQD